MTHRAAGSKTTGKTEFDSSHSSSAGGKAAAIAPPSYGIAFVDQGLSASAAPLPQGKLAPIQKQDGPEEEDLLQGKFDAVQSGELESEPVSHHSNTGLPGKLKSGIESLSGLALDDVRVHYNSSRPAQLNALAYAQGSDIHLAPGQERHLPHEAWHVVQQAQGRVKPKLQAKGVLINDDPALEHEADVMGERAAAGHGQDLAQRARLAPIVGIGEPMRETKHIRAFDADASRYSSNPGLASPESIQCKKTRLTEEEKASLEPFDAKYDECRNRGEKKIWPAIAAAAKTPVVKKEGSERKEGGEIKEAEAKSTNKERFQAEYETLTFSADHKAGVYEIKSAAKAEKKEELPAPSESDAKQREALRRLMPVREKVWQYTNKFDVKKKQITAKRNWADQDPTPERLNNSEIIWFQYEIAARQYQQNNTLNKDKTKKLLKVKDVFRDNVVTEETRAVVDLAYPNGKSWRKGNSCTWKPPSADFFAVLGTKNCQGVGWMLAQHVFEMEGRRRKITEIEAEGSKTMELKLKVHLQRDKSSS